MDAAVVQFFESVRNPALTAFFSVFSLLGEPVVLAAIVAVLFWVFPRRGEGALVALLLSFPLCSYMKYTARRPRPYVSGGVEKLSPPLSSSLDDYASFPSGHASASAALFGGIFQKKHLPLSLGLFAVVLLIAISRLYFGVHYLSDVLFGLAVGLILSILWALIDRVAHEFRYLFLLFFALLSLVPVFFSPSGDYLTAAGLLCGGAAALPLLAEMNQKEAEFSRRLWRIPVGVSVFLLLGAYSLFLEGGALLKSFLLLSSGLIISESIFEKLEI